MNKTSIFFKTCFLAVAMCIVAVEANYAVALPSVDAQKPEIFVNPMDSIYDQYANADPLMVWAEVSDGGTLSYQWYSNVDNNSYSGTPVGTNSDTYTPSTATAGTMHYYVIVTNTIVDNGDGGSKSAIDTSAVAIITVNAVSLPPVDAQKPEIFVNPMDSIYDQYANADPLMVWAEVSDGGTLSYQWYSNVDNNSYSGDELPGATEAEYTPSTATAGTMHYYVIVTNTIVDNGDGGEKSAIDTSAVAIITVNAVSLPPVDAQKPEIFVNPMDSIYTQYANADPLMVWAEVSDGGTLSYQWYSNVSNNSYSGTPVGTNSDTYTPSTATAGTMYYYVIVTNTIVDNGDGGSKSARDTSRVAVIIVIPELLSGNGVVEGVVSDVLSAVTQSGITVYLYILEAFLTKSTAPEGYVLVGVTETDANGKYSFPNLPEGSYRVVVDIDGNTATSLPIDLTEGATGGSVNFTVDSNTGTIVAEAPDIIGGGGGGNLSSVSELNNVNSLRAWIRGGMLHITGLTVGEALSIYTSSGALVYQNKPNSTEIDIPLATQGVYIIRSGANTVRVVFE